LRSALESLETGVELVVGLGPGLALRLGVEPSQLRPFPAMRSPGVVVPSSQADLWLWIRGEAPGATVLNGVALVGSLSGLFEFDKPVDGFKHGEGSAGRGLDLTGYEDGTENPEGAEAVAAAIANDGSSFVAVQQWRHDLAGFDHFSQQEKDFMIGRRLSDNEELDDAPESAHVKRTAQESFEPEAFLLRRSLPWAGPDGEGLMFVAFGFSLDAYEAQMRRMAGLDDGITDALFRFSTPVTGGYFWCPPLLDNRLFIG
jgi:putative iron-dependent peroxidase